MYSGENREGCRGKAGIWAGITGVVVAIFLMVVAHEPFYVAIFLGLLTVLLFGGFLIWAFCSGDGAPGAADGTGAAPAPVPNPGDLPSPSELATPSTAFKAQSPEGAAARDQAEAAAPSEAPAAMPQEVVAPEPIVSQEAPEIEPAPAPEPAPEAEPEAEAVPAAPAEAEPASPEPEPVAQPVAADGAGRKPDALDAPRDGKADDLKKIEGIGPKLEERLNDWGIYHFDQIANWGPEEVAYADENVPRFKGRCSRDKWVAQAKIIVTEGMDAFLERAKTNDY